MSHSASDHAGVALMGAVGDEDAPDVQRSSQATKRKRDEIQHDAEAATESTRSKKNKRQTQTQTETKTKTKTKTNKARHNIADDALDTEKHVNHAIRHMDPSLLADHVAQRTQRFQASLSHVEAAHLRIAERAIIDTAVFPAPRTTHVLPAFLEAFAGQRRTSKRGKTGQPGGLANASKQMGSPHTLVIAGSGLRAADLTRVLRRFQTKESAVAKLFAKHIKLRDAVEMCGRTRMGIGVGTPQRVWDLIEEGALRVERLERVVVDASHIDLKKRGILDMQETQVPLVKLLARDEWKGRYAGGDGEKGTIDLLFF